MISVVNPEIKHLSLASEPNSLLSLESWVNSICDGYKISVELYGNILITLSEAVNNAIIHGNENQIEKKATVISKIEQEKIVFSVLTRVLALILLNFPIQPYLKILKNLREEASS